MQLCHAALQFVADNSLPDATVVQLADSLYYAVVGFGIVFAMHHIVLLKAGKTSFHIVGRAVCAYSPFYQFVHPIAHKPAHLVVGTCRHATLGQCIIGAIHQVGKGIHQGTV